MMYALASKRHGCGWRGCFILPFSSRNRCPFSDEWSGNRQSWFAHDKPSGRAAYPLDSNSSRQDDLLPAYASVGMTEARRSWGWPAARGGCVASEPAKGTPSTIPSGRRIAPPPINPIPVNIPSGKRITSRVAKESGASPAVFSQRFASIMATDAARQAKKVVQPGVPCRNATSREPAAIADARQAGG
jgi:hypothetical protein